jgi:hypothetical protein
MSGLKQVCACWDMSWGVTYAASAQCDSVKSECKSSEPVCEVSKKLLDLEQRSVIKFLTKEGKKPKEILWTHGGSLWGVCPFLLQSEILE